MKCIKNVKLNKALIYIALLIVIIDITYFVYKFEFKYKDKIDITANYILEIIKIQKYDEEYISYVAKIKNDKFIIYIYNNDIVYLPGNKISIVGKITKIEKYRNLGETSYKLYLNSNNIVGSISVTRVNKVIDNKVNFVFNLKQNIEYKVSKFFDDDMKNTFKSLIYGDDNLLDDKIKDKFEKCGMLHILSISGFNIYIYIKIIKCIVNITKKRKTTALINILFVSLFIIFCELKITIVRAGITYILLNILDLFDITLKNKYLRVLYTYLILFLLNPYMVFNVSLIYAFFCIVGIIMFDNLINSYFSVKLLKFKKNFILNFIIKNLSTLLSVNILLIPINIYYGTKIYITMVISSIILVPVIELYVSYSYITLLFIFIPIISDILLKLNLIFLKLIFFVVDFVYNLNLSYVSFPKPSIIILIFYYLFLLYFYNSKYLILFCYNKKIRKKIKNIVNITFVFFVILNIFLYIKIMYFEKYVVFFNVGQGNMALIHNLNVNIVIDMRSTKNNLASNTLQNFFKVKNISNIDIVFLTHFDNDHVNGILQLVENVNTEKIVYQEPKEKNELFDTIYNLTRNNNISFVEVTKGDTFTFNNINVQILSPDKNIDIDNKDSSNSNSLIIYVKINNMKNSTYLFMGDATVKSERYLLDNLIIKNKKIDVLQVGHHGSNTSTSKELLEYFNIKNAVISSKKEVYGHPTKEVLEILSNYNINILITENLGMIVFK